MPSFHDLEVARATSLKPITEIAQKTGIPDGAVIPYGRLKAKIDLNWLLARPENPSARLVLVTAINPTAAGEGKTTTTIGLGDGLRRIGKRAVVALREPSLGPCFGQKGGATGGGKAQVAPMDDINLHFNGDFHAITAAHNLLAAMLDNHVYWGNTLNIDTRRISWRRAMDMNDRALRATVVGLDGNGAVREDGFDITVASEVMAIFCLAKSRADLEARLSRMVLAQKRGGGYITAKDLKAVGAMSALLNDALSPNLVQTLEGTPAFIHGGPFANIAHGCNSVIATRGALTLADIVVTEAGFGADLGAEKFLDIKCPQGGLAPSAIVVVATVRALKLHGGMAKAELGRADVEALRRGLPNLKRHVENMKGYGVPVVVAINHFTSDSADETSAILDAAKEWGVTAHLCRHWAEGGAGTEGLARDVAALVETPSQFSPLYPDAMALEEKIKTIATKIYRARDVAFSDIARKKLGQYEKEGYGGLRVCMAKTQYSFSADPALAGAPEGFTLPVRDVRLSAGAGFVVALAGDILTMPGLPRTPAAEAIHVDEKGLIQGLF